MNVMKKLQACRVELQALEIKKSGHNKFAGYTYMELGDFLPAINNLFNKHGLFSAVSYDEKMATLTITDVEDNSSVTFTSPMGSAALKGCHEVQNIGAVETYQRRYLYVTALEIVEHDALDASTKPEGKVTPTAGVEEHLSKEDMERAYRVVSSVVDCLNANMPEEAARVLTESHENFSAEGKIYIWKQLDSKQRALLKKTLKQPEAV